MTFRTLPPTDELPRALYTAEQVRGFDRIAIEQFDIPGETLMERAGAAAFELLRKKWPDAKRIAILVGTGNNGGDGFVVARLAKKAGLQVQVLQLGDPARLQGDALTNAKRWEELDGDWQAYAMISPDVDVIVDAMFGTGLERPVAGRWAEAIETINSHRSPCLAIDIPSGLHSDSGMVMGTAVRAAATISFIGLKLGLFSGDGPDHVGDVVFAGLDVPAKVFATSVLTARRVDWPKLGALLPPRRHNVHKGNFGHVLIIGGNRGMGGAARMAAEAALRVGSGLVSLATRPEHVGAVLAARPEIMVNGVEGSVGVLPLLRQADVIAIGPGLGRDDWAQALWRAALDSDRPLVVDADALHLLAAKPRRRNDWVLTPHPGEAAALLGMRTADVNAARLHAVDQMQQRFGGSVVLKGVGSLIASEGAAPPALCSDGNPGMASGGMGDVLTGVIAGLLAQGLSVRDAAEAGVCVHAAAADWTAGVAGERGLLATDLFEPLRVLINDRWRS